MWNDRSGEVVVWDVSVWLWRLLTVPGGRAGSCRNERGDAEHPPASWLALPIRMIVFILFSPISISRRV
jgi:hypothetical protein